MHYMCGELVGADLINNIMKSNTLRFRQCVWVNNIAGFS